MQLSRLSFRHKCHNTYHEQWENTAHGQANGNVLAVTYHTRKNSALPTSLVCYLSSTSLTLSQSIWYFLYRLSPLATNAPELEGMSTGEARLAVPAASHDFRLFLKIAPVVINQVAHKEDSLISNISPYYA
jgi:hypothetical protein